MTFHLFYNFGKRGGMDDYQGTFETLEAAQQATLVDVGFAHVATLKDGQLVKVMELEITHTPITSDVPVYPVYFNGKQVREYPMGQATTRRTWVLKS